MASWEAVEGDGCRSEIESNWLFRLGRQRFRSTRSGKTHDFYVMELPDAVHVIAVTPEKQVVLVRQFRAGSGEDSLETPGGLVEPGEDPCVAGARELREETGYAGDPPRLISTVWAVPSILRTRISTIVIENARRVDEQKLDPNEEVQVELMDVEEVAGAVRDGRIGHALVVQGILAWLAGYGIGESL